MAKRGTRFTSMGGGPQLKYTITLTTANYPTGIKYPVYSKPADIMTPSFGVAERRVWRQDEWVMGWGQQRFVDKERFWYGTVNSFRNNELSAGARLFNPVTNISAAGVTKFGEYGSTRTLYAAAAAVLYSYNFTTEAWASVAGCATTTAIVDVQEINGVMYVTQTTGNYYTLTNTTWADGGSAGAHFAARSDTGGTTPTAPTLYKANGNTVSWGAAWANSAVVGGSEDAINALVTYKNDLYALKSDGMYLMTKTSETTAKFLCIQDFATQRSANTGKYWAIWNDRLWFNLGTSLAAFDGAIMRLMEYPWSVSPTNLYDINSICAMDDALLVGFYGYALAYHDHGADQAGDWHYCMANGTRKFQALWFTRIPATNRIFYGFDTDAANNTSYSIMANGLFIPNTFATSNLYFSSIFDDTDETVQKWAMQVIAYCENCDVNDTVQFAYAADGGAYVNIGNAITASGYSILPTATTFIVDGSGNKLAFRRIQIRATIYTQGSNVTPIIKSIELLFVPIRPNKRRFTYSLLCSDEWEVGSEYARYTSQQYWDELWAASNQNTPITLTDEFGTGYTVFLNLSGSPTYTEEGAVKGMVVNVQLHEP